MKKYVVLMVVLFSILLAACGGGSKAATTLKVEMTDFAFSPSEVSVPAGQEITLELSNKGAVEHEWVIMKEPGTQPFDADDEEKVYWEIELEAGESTTVKFTAPSTSGEYQLICGIPGHWEAGMVGKLMVVNP